MNKYIWSQFMILFESDWNKYHSAIVDTKTKNTSFLKAAALYKSMGIKNYYFMLTLLQPELQGIDPYDKSLSPEIKTKIALECQYNPWYFFREVARIPNGSNPVLFKANRGVITLLWCFLVGIDVVLIMPRQFGKSTVMDVLDIWLLYYNMRNAKIFLFTKDTGLRKSNIKRIKNTLREIPAWLNPECKQDLDNTEVITCVNRNNVLLTAVGQAQEDRASNVGRGETPYVIHVDEVAWIPNNFISIPVLLASNTQKRIDAEKTGELYGIIYTTSAGKLDSKEGKYAYGIVSSGMVFSEKLFDSLDKYEAREIVYKNSVDKTTTVTANFTHRHLGVSDEEIAQRAAITKGTREDIERDFYSKWTSGSGIGPIDTYLLEIIKSSEIDPLYSKMSKDKYITRWYIPYDEIEDRMRVGKFILGIDTSEACGADSNALILCDVTDMGVIWAANVNEANLNTFALWLVSIIIMYPNITVIYENKSSAPVIFDIVFSKLISLGIDPFKRIYNTIVDKKETTTVNEFNEITAITDMDAKNDQCIRYKKRFGFMTNGDSRKVLYDIVLDLAVKSTGHLVKDKVLSSELKGLIRKNGRVDHGPGGHDDTVIAWMLCHWFVRYARNLSYYGINATDCLSLVSENGATITEDELINKQLSARLQLEIAEIKDRMLSCMSVVESVYLEKKLKTKIGHVNTLEPSSLNYDAVVKDIKDKKVTKVNLRSSLDKINMGRLFQ
jgi:hypothetical protein